MEWNNDEKELDRKINLLHNITTKKKWNKEELVLKDLKIKKLQDEYNILLEENFIKNVVMFSNFVRLESFGDEFGVLPTTDEVKSDG